MNAASLQSLAGMLGLAFASGVNLYAAVLVVGLGIRYELLKGLPAELAPLAHPAVLVTAGLLYCLEFFADKIPVLSALWDGIHTFVRPLGAVAMSLLASSQLGAVEQTVIALLGGAVALTSHATKMGVRLISQGEPATHAGLSVAEDIFAVSLTALAAQYPWLALGVTLVLLVAAVLILVFAWKTVNRMAKGIGNRFRIWLGMSRRDASGSAPLSC
ncbi:MAG: DUF4126 domain-containing protein [Bryobacteraceae bacterium]|nr:DUF4126 domain-containing protein [Bryobacteraceae bacterium]MDW8379562.1 DUF4126 domain-containing protein [Bryobacterales bacterium]